MEFVGRTVNKMVTGLGLLSGTVKSYDSSSSSLEILYSNGYSEHLIPSDVASLLEQPPPPPPPPPPDHHHHHPTKRPRLHLNDHHSEHQHSRSGNFTHHLNSPEAKAAAQFNGNLEGNDSSAGAACGDGKLDSQFDRNLGLGNGNVSGIFNGSVVSLEKEIRFENSLDHNTASANVNANANANANADSPYIKLQDGIDLNDTFVLDNEEGHGLKNGMDSIDLNVGVAVDKEEDGANLGVERLAGLETAMMEDGKIDLNVGLCEEGKEAEGVVVGNGLSEVDALLAKARQLREEEQRIGVDQKFVEDGGASGNLNGGNRVSTQHAAEDATTCLKEEMEGGGGKGDTAAVDSTQVANATSDKDCDYVEVRQTDSPSEYQEDPGSPSKQGRNSQRKRRKVSYDLKNTPETLLRRSSRRSSARQQVSGSVAFQGMDDPSLSAGPSSLTDEKPVISGDETYEQCNIPPPKLQLPPSSQNLNLGGLPVLELFTIYSFLRSFSTLLFLSPFELEDLVAALKSETPSILFDSIHVSLLQILRKHLEYLSNEGCQSAADCLRNLNWDFLDLLTWPIFMAEYLLIHGSVFKTTFDLNHLMFKTDYCKQPVNVKVKILQGLCDDMIEVEAIRSELNRRSLLTETDMGFDQSMFFDTCKKRRGVTDMSGGSCLTEENANDTTDWNSDECCLCKMDGILICCDGCPAAFHSRCVGIASDSLPEGNWYCPECSIGTHGAWMKSRRSLRGAELLGTDVHGRLYFNSCGYLLVSDSSDTDSMFNYYHKNDIHVVIEVLKSMGTLLGSIVMAIHEHFDIPTNSSVGTSDLAVVNQNSRTNVHTGGIYSAMDASLAPFTLPETCLDNNLVDDQRKSDENSTIDGRTHPGQEFPKAGSRLDSMTTIESPCGASEGSADTTQMRPGIESGQMSGLYESNRSDESLNQSGIPGKHNSVGDCSLTSSSLYVGRKINLRSMGASCTPSTDTKNTSEVPCGVDYINFYSFARTASLVAQELMCKPPEKINEDLAMSDEDIISDQAKAIMKKSSDFCWPSIQNLGSAAEKEKCGWCFSCKADNDDRDCLFNVVLKPVWEVSDGSLVGLQSGKIQNGHLRALIYHLVSLEDRLRGLLLGPWLDPYQTNLWHMELMKTTDFLPVKRFLLLLESNLRPFALSADWLKHADSCTTMGSSTHIVVSSSRTSSRHSITRKRARNSDIRSNSSSKTTSGLGIYWWRGGRLSRQLFNWKSLPRSLVSKAARQAGCTKIPGILYPENSDFARRSKYVAWRAAVEMSTSVEQLALQVRELFSNIKWHDIENRHPQFLLDKESRKSVRLFKKAIVRRKCSEGQSVKYLIDFGKRRAIPDIVVKHGSLLEESTSERKKYWLDESYLPLHLLKNFEEKRIVRKSSEKKHGEVIELGRVNKRIPREEVFSYLLSKLKRSECQQCGHCNKDVPIGEAVSCLYCEGSFHKRHVRKSGGTSATGCTYSCHRCLAGMRVKTNNSNRRKVDSKVLKIQSQKSQNLPSLCKPVNLKGNKKALSKVPQARSQTNKKVPVSVPLRRSVRKVKSLYLRSQMNGGRKKGKQSKKNVGHKKVKQSKSKKLSQKSQATIGQRKELVFTVVRKKRTDICSSYWLNGLWFSGKANDERVILFREKKHVVSSEDFLGTLDHHKCRLCCLDGSTSNYIVCEKCGDWFHGDAFGLTFDNARQLIGFICHDCRGRAAPICPHMKINAVSHSERYVAIEGSEELPNPVSLQPVSENDRAQPIMQVYTRRPTHGRKRDERREEEGGTGISDREYLGPHQEVINTESKNEGEQENGNQNQLASCHASIGVKEDSGTTTAGGGVSGGMSP